MTFHITHRLGSVDGPQSISDLSDLLSELGEDIGDEEHASVSVTHETEWCLSAYGGGYVVFEHLENGGERHMRGVSDAQIIRLWTCLANGDIQAVEEALWCPGY